MQILETRADEGLQSNTCALLWTFFLALTGKQLALHGLCPGRKCPKAVKHRDQTPFVQTRLLSSFLDNLNIYLYIYSSLDGEILKGVLVSSLVPACSIQLIYACEFI